MVTHSVSISVNLTSMSHPFAFPPPPPPPPKPVQHGTFAPAQTRGAHRGRGNSGSRGRGRGQYSTQNQSRGGFAGRGNGMTGISTGYGGQKRDHSAAFQTTSDDTLRKSRPLAPPAVPSFGIDFNALLSKKSESVNSNAGPNAVEAKPAKGNALGLTPRASLNDSEDSDVDEEVELAHRSRPEDGLKFEYQGRTSVLSSSEDIAAWIAERRKKWPTQAKRETAEQEAAEKRQKWQEEKEARAKVSQAAAKARQEEYLKQKAEREKSRIRQKLIQEQVKKAKDQAVSKTPQTDAEAKAEKLRRKAEKIAKQLDAAEQALQGKKQHLEEEDDIDALLNQVNQAAASQQGKASDLDNELASLSSSSDEDADDTSSSGSSDSDSEINSNSEPEEATTKRSGPERILAPPRKTAPGATSDTRQPCQKFVRTGQCRYGRKCRYRHDKADRRAVLQKDSGVGNRRKGLYQVMVDKEAEEEKRRALRAIITIGDAGLLDSSETDQNAKD